VAQNPTLVAPWPATALPLLRPLPVSGGLHVDMNDALRIGLPHRWPRRCLEVLHDVVAEVVDEQDIERVGVIGIVEVTQSPLVRVDNARSLPSAKDDSKNWRVRLAAERDLTHLISEHARAFIGELHEGIYIGFTQVVSGPLDGVAS
jgi:hypothetical protein